MRFYSYSNGDSSSFDRLEAIGYRVGTKLIQKLTKDKSLLFVDNLDRMKFLCKDVYSFLYDKQVDNLRTNHKGMYVVQDNQFKHSTTNNNNGSSLKSMALHCGVLRGCLDVLMGCPVTVLAETGSMPQVTFKFELISK
ncbi:hypothetical protein MP638_006470 [Amoeboaphelidium occidentale]|nr:hypothetical protein MP638_006470 [Amoeboaphelidium occidentale]